jgi:ketosteroid isomerase-like protein
VAERSSGTFHGTVHDILGSDHHAVGLLRVTAARKDRELDMPVVHVVHVTNGRITEIWAHPRDQYAVDEFWGDSSNDARDRVIRPAWSAYSA